MAEPKTIDIRGAQTNNLKHIDVSIPRGRLVVVTGVSGSGKSSLAFDTLYAEGQRRYVESLSSYARQFLGRMSKPECDFISGIPPAIAIEQRVTSRNPRSTVGTSTEVYEYLRLLYARIGRTYSPVSGQEVRRHTVDDIVACMTEHDEGTRLYVLAPLPRRADRTTAEQIDAYARQGFTRIEVTGRAMKIDEYSPHEGDVVFLLIDRLTASAAPDTISRLTDSVETAIYEGDGACLLRFFPREGGSRLYRFSTRFEADGIAFEEPTDSMFAFNSPAGACPECEGFGRIVGIDEHLVVPNRALSVYEGAVVCWRGEKMDQWREQVIRGAEAAGFPIFKPYYQLTDAERTMLWQGSPGHFEGIDAFFRMVQENVYKIQYRVLLSRYRGKTLCPVCRGTRLRREATYVKVGGRSLTELVDLPVSELKLFFDSLRLTDHERAVASRLLAEIDARLQYLIDVGLDYLTLNRPSHTLSGGESQRINLSTSLGSSLVGSMYILDEPSIGLHPRDTQRLIGVLRKLQRVGNTVIVVEHDEEIMRAADYLIDIGPDAGRLGGQVVYQGPVDKLLKDPTIAPDSHTAHYLRGEETIATPTTRRPWTHSIDIRGARENNLQGIDVRLPLNVLTVVTGVSGSGKSTLVRDILYLALKRELDEAEERPGEFIAIEGYDAVRHVEFVDQNPIGKSTRSNPVTYIKAYEEIRRLWSEQPLAKQMGYTAGFFSFNSEGGRCEECKGEGVITVEMQFMADLKLTCESCHGRRFKADTLEVKYDGLSIYDVLELTVDQAVDFFLAHDQQRIVRRLLPLQSVGLGYIKLGQSSATLSGGENQRVKLAYYLAQEKSEPTLFIFDEPTTGLHPYDISRLLHAFDALILRGHSIVVIEHNADIIRSADYVIDLGPEGGRRGGRIVAQGTPEEVAACRESYTGQYLKGKL